MVAHGYFECSPFSVSFPSLQQKTCCLVPVKILSVASQHDDTYWNSYTFYYYGYSSDQGRGYTDREGIKITSRIKDGIGAVLPHLMLSCLLSRLISSMYSPTLKCSYTSYQILGPFRGLGEPPNCLRQLVCRTNARNKERRTINTALCKPLKILRLWIFLAKR